MRFLILMLFLMVSTVFAFSDGSLLLFENEESGYFSVDQDSVITTDLVPTDSTIFITDNCVDKKHKTEEQPALISFNKTLSGVAVDSMSHKANYG